jgi:hypothetical protein
MPHPDQQYHCKRVEVRKVSRPKLKDVLPQAGIACIRAGFDLNIECKKRNRDTKYTVTKSF